MTGGSRRRKSPTCLRWVVLVVDLTNQLFVEVEVDELDVPPMRSKRARHSPNDYPFWADPHH